MAVSYLISSFILSVPYSLKSGSLADASQLHDSELSEAQAIKFSHSFQFSKPYYLTEVVIQRVFDTNKEVPVLGRTILPTSNS